MGYSWPECDDTKMDCSCGESVRIDLCTPCLLSWHCTYEVGEVAYCSGGSCEERKNIWRGREREK